MNIWDSVARAVAKLREHFPRQAGYHRGCGGRVGPPEGADSFEAVTWLGFDCVKCQKCGEWVGAGLGDPNIEYRDE